MFISSPAASLGSGVLPSILPSWVAILLDTFYVPLSSGAATVPLNAFGSRICRSSDRLLLYFARWSWKVYAFHWGPGLRTRPFAFHRAAGGLCYTSLLITVVHNGHN